jgi:hypothetical protein
MQAYVLLGIPVVDRGDMIMDLNVPAQFLADFTLDAVRQRLSVVNFSSRKLPKPGQVAVRRTPGKQNAAVMPDDSRAYFNEIFGFGHRQGRPPDQGLPADANHELGPAVLGMLAVRGGVRNGRFFLAITDGLDAVAPYPQVD